MTGCGFSSWFCAENSANERYLGYAALAYSVTAIDDITVPLLTKKIQLEALVQRLDEDGFEAIGKGVSENFQSSESSEADAVASIKRVEHSDLVTCLWLVKNGVPYDVAFSLDPVDRMAYTIIFGQMEGKQWDWNSLSWT